MKNKWIVRCCEGIREPEEGELTVYNMDFVTHVYLEKAKYHSGKEEWYVKAVINKSHHTIAVFGTICKCKDWIIENITTI